MSYESWKLRDRSERVWGPNPGKLATVITRETYESRRKARQTRHDAPGDDLRDCLWFLVLSAIAAILAGVVAMWR